MTLGNPRGGIGYGSEFQSSALPWVTSSIATTTPAQFTFHKVSRFISLVNLGASTDFIKLGFTENGVKNNNHILIQGGAPPQPFEFRVKEVWVAAVSGSLSFSLVAGLTNIDETMMPQLSGTLYDNSVGWEGVG